MWVIIKQNFVRYGPLIAGGKNSGKYKLEIDRIVESLDDIKEGEVYFKCHVKN